MKRTKTEPGKKRATIVFATVTVLFLSLCIFCVGTAMYVETHFLRRVEETLYLPGQIARSPRFYVYHFSDRVNRQGEAVEVTETVYAQQQNKYVSYEDLPQALIDAFVAIEDKRFFEHNGVDWYRTAAACVNYLVGTSNHFGASTITQQLVKNMTGENQVTLKRKLQEIFYALDLERILDKNEILELYLNVIHFSDHCDGIAAASQHYFSKAPQDLSIAECATIAAITNYPSYYNPIRHPENNLSRRNLILSEMYAHGFLSEDQYLEEVNTPLLLNVDYEANEERINPWYTDMVIEDVISDLMSKYDLSRAAATRWFYTGGLRIDMAMDENLQNLVESYYQSAITLPKNENGVSAQSALILMDSRTGDILAVAGAAGKKNGNHIQNFATQTLRPPGSALKPISVYAPALEEGIINWASVFDDVPTDFDLDGHTYWPQNANRVYRGLTDVAYAVAHSTNTVAVRVLRELGNARAFDYAKERFHLTSLIPKKRNSDTHDEGDAALALGQLSYGVTLRELTTAYTAFADGGTYHPYRSYYRVLAEDGTVLLSRGDMGEQILSSWTAAVMTKLLQGVVASGSDISETLLRMTECAGKTGTSGNEQDRWFIGYTPDMICGVWCGYEYPEAMGGKNISTVIWSQMMKTIVSQTEGRSTFSVPNEVIRVSYCKDSGALPTEVCSLDPRGTRTAVGWFVRGTEPHDFCNCHVRCCYDAENGGICHGYCQKEVIRTIGLIHVERHFPIQLYVTDAQYVLCGDATLLPVNPEAGEPYFGIKENDFCGISDRTEQFNRSCTVHGTPNNEADLDGQTGTEPDADDRKKCPTEEKHSE